MGRVLVLGDDNRSTLTVVRSLGRRKVEVLLGTQQPHAVAALSRYVKQTYHLPSTEDQVEAWLDEVEKILRAQSVELVIPCPDDALTPLMQNRERFAKLTRLALPNDQSYAYSYHKEKTFALAAELGVPIPETRLIETLDALDPLPQTYPIIVKPITSKVWRNGQLHVLTVKAAQTADEVRKSVSEIIDVTPVLLQSYFPGTGVGQEFLVHEGQIISQFQHQRVHERHGGGSSYRKSVPINERMLVHSAKMLSHLKWTGVVMVEYKQNGDEFVLIEINGRFWGSLPLAVANGVDFPYQLYQLLVEGKTADCESYQPGLHARNLLQDVGWFSEQIKQVRGTKNRLRLLGQEALYGAKNLLTGKERLDTLTLDDPRPGLTELRTLIGQKASKVNQVAHRRAYQVLARQPGWRKKQLEKVAQLLANQPHLLFVCFGNICRSPFAEQYMRQQLDQHGLGHIQVSSSGSYPQLDRPSPENAQLAAAHFAIPLTVHRSRVLDQQQIAAAGAIICMDYKNYQQLTADFPGIQGKLFFLHTLNPAHQAFEIPDPWGKSLATFEECYQCVADDIDALVGFLRGQHD